MKILITITTLLFTSLASAGILIEPQLGYAFSHKLKQTVTITLGNASGTVNADSSGTALEVGGRFGYQAFGLMLGGSYMKGFSDKGSNLGAFVGYSAPILLRAWAGYNFDSKVNYGSDAATGKSIEFGVGYTALPLLSLNFVYRKYDMDKLTHLGVTYNTSGVTPTELMIAISAPFNLF
jgi:hypothetical protein